MSPVRPTLPTPEVILVSNQRQLRAALRTFGDEVQASWADIVDSAGMTWTYGPGKWIVGLNFPALTSGEDALGVLVHEATHVKQQYLRYLGEDRPGDEMEAYLMQAISGNLLAQYRKIVMGRMRKRPRKA